MTSIEWPRKPGSKGERIYDANYALLTISIFGRRFFYNSEHNRVARFEMTIDGRLWFRDDYTNRRIYVAYRGGWRHFSHGGTLRRLVDALARYIRTGKQISPSHFGPWPDHYCDGDLWGYGKDSMEILRRALKPRRCIAWPAAALSSPPSIGGEVARPQGETERGSTR